MDTTASPALLEHVNRTGTMRSLGDFLALLEREHPEEVLRVSDPVDPKACDPAAYEEFFAQHQRYPWLVFEHALALDGSRWPGLFSTYTDTALRRIALAYGLDPAAIGPRDITDRYDAGMNNPEPPEVISRREAPIKEIVRNGPDLTLDFLPFFRNAEKDSGPGWLTPIFVVRDPETGRYNLSWHRGQYLGPRRFTAEFQAGRHIRDIFAKYKAAGKPMPCAAVIGHHPVFGDAAATAFRGVDEYEGVGGLYRQGTGSRLRVVPSETWGEDFLVPADAEIVLEGYLLDEYVSAGPWSDYWWIYLEPMPMNICEVTAVTMRERPIFVSIWPAIEVHGNSTGVLFNRLKPFFPGIRDIYVPFPQTAIVSYRPRMPGEAMHLAGTLLSFCDLIKNVIVIDDDLDPRDLESVFFSLATRMDARDRVVIMPVSRSVYDPSTDRPTVGGLLIDATKPRDDLKFEIAKPPRDRIEEVGRRVPREVLWRMPSGSPYRL